ncbi:MAG TPA: tetratricopeptide repeat protein [Acidobacteriaceae bacterium]|nr:tetratricopeptide repeat protein [Acidobacteriaceae bacterium]
MSNSIALLLLMLISGLPKIYGQRQTTAPNTGSSQPSLSSIQHLIDSGHSAQALQQLDVLASQTPEAPGVERMRGIAFYQQGDLIPARAAFAKAVAQDPADRQSALMDGVTLFRMGHAAEAIPLLERSNGSVAATNVDANYVLGLCYMDTRRYDDARRSFAAEYGFPPDSPSAYLLAARLMLRREYLPVAEQFTRKAISLSSTLPLAHLLLGEIDLAESKLPEAIAEFQAERALNPLYPGLYDRLGDAYVRSGDYAGAQQSLDRAVILEPTSTGPFILLGKTLLKQKNPAMAIMYLNRALKMDPSNYMTHALLGQAYRAVGRTEDASREFQIAEKIQAATAPKPPAAH